MRHPGRGVARSDGGDVWPERTTLQFLCTQIRLVHPGWRDGPAKRLCERRQADVLVTRFGSVAVEDQLDAFGAEGAQIHVGQR